MPDPMTLQTLSFDAIYFIKLIKIRNNMLMFTHAQVLFRNTLETMSRINYRQGAV